MVVVAVVVVVVVVVGKMVEVQKRPEWWGFGWR
jgi:hypothetical protein